MGCTSLLLLLFLAAFSVQQDIDRHHRRSTVLKFKGNVAGSGVRKPNCCGIGWAQPISLNLSSNGQLKVNAQWQQAMESTIHTCGPLDAQALGSAPSITFNWTQSGVLEDEEILQGFFSDEISYEGDYNARSIRDNLTISAVPMDEVDWTMKMIFIRLAKNTYNVYYYQNLSNYGISEICEGVWLVFLDCHDRSPESLIATQVNHIA